MPLHNDLKRTLENDGAAFGGATSTHSPATVETLGAIGLDFVWVDFEHGGPSPWDSTVLEDLTRAADAADTELLVRLPSADPHLVRKVLDAGVGTILISRIETAAEIRRAARAARFTYDGNPGDRGIGIGRTSTWGKDLDPAYVDREDDAVLLGAMIETREAVENVDEILSVSELGFAFVGPADLSVSLGHPMRPSHPDVETAIGTVEDAVRESTLALGGIRNDPEEAASAIEDGYRLLRIGSDLSIVRSVLSERLADVSHDGER